MSLLNWLDDRLSLWRSGCEASSQFAGSNLQWAVVPWNIKKGGKEKMLRKSTLKQLEAYHYEVNVVGITLIENNAGSM